MCRSTVENYREAVQGTPTFACPILLEVVVAKGKGRNDRRALEMRSWQDGGMVERDLCGGKGRSGEGRGCCIGAYYIVSRACGKCERRVCVSPGTAQKYLVVWCLLGAKGGGIIIEVAVATSWALAGFMKAFCDMLLNSGG